MPGLEVHTAPAASPPRPFIVRETTVATPPRPRLLDRVRTTLRIYERWWR
jgi:hypothetical protein